MIDMKTPGIDIRPLRELTGHGDVQRGVLRRRVRPRRLPRRPGERRLALRRARRSPTSASTWVASNTIGGGVVGVLRAIEARGRGRRHARARRGRRARRRPATRSRCSASASRCRRWPAPTRRVPRPRCASCSACSTTSTSRRSASSLMGADAAADEGDAAAWVGSFLFNRCLTIAGGTSDIQRNVIAERLLGLAARSLSRAGVTAGGQPPSSKMATTSQRRSCECTRCATDARRRSGTVPGARRRRSSGAG